MKPIKKIFLEQLGCAKNQAEGERILGTLVRTGNYILVPHPEEADIIFINTCSFIQESQTESIDTILGYESAAENGEQEVWVTGCFMDSHPEEIQQSFSSKIRFFNLKEFDVSGYERVLTSFPASAYLKIAEGCHRQCAFCTIPLFKGGLESRKPKEILQEAEYLVKEKGIRELILVAQDTSSYGNDLGNTSLTQLVNQLEKISELKWIRLLYLYPSELDRDFFKWAADTEKLCPYFDIPIQHTVDEVLRAMQREGGRKQVMQCMEWLRHYLPHACARTSIIVGFPGETDAYFQQLVKDIQELAFQWLGCFMFSDEPEAMSYAYSGKISKKVKQHRFEQIFEIQKPITQQWLNSRIGTTETILIEESIPQVAKEDQGTIKSNETNISELSSTEEDTSTWYYSLGRSRFEAPEVDGSIVLINLDIPPGTFVDVSITHIREYDLIAEQVK